MIEIRVIGEDHETVKKDIAFLAAQFGVVTGEVTLEQVSEDTVVGTAIGEPPKRRGRKTNAEKAAEALSGEEAPVEEDAAEDPFSTDDEPEAEVDLEKVRAATLERLQRLYASKGGVDSGNALLAKHGKGVKKFAKLPLEVFPAIAADLDVLEVA
jgi:hypothetical protein